MKFRIARHPCQTSSLAPKITRTRALAISILLAPMLIACSSPPQQGYRIGSEVYQSAVDAEVALTNGEPREVFGAPSDQKIRLLRAPMPIMPTVAISADLDDLVTVRILFNEAGDVENVVPGTYKHPVLLEAVLTVVRDWKIEPHVEAGRRVKTTVMQSFRFELE